MTDLLKKRLKQFKIPAASYQPRGDLVLVWRLPPEEMSMGGKGRIFIPEESRTARSKGVLVAMGTKAKDEVTCDGIEEGQVVTWGKYAGFEPDDEKVLAEEDAETAEEAKVPKFLILRARELLGSEDLKHYLESGDLKVIKGHDGKHYTVTRDYQLEAPPEVKQLEGRVEKLETMAKRTDNPNEARAAREALKATKRKLKNARARA